MTDHPARRRDPAKARAAAAHPDRPGQECQAELGAFRPEVNRRRCEGKADCEAVCPHNVFEIGVLDEEAFYAMPTLDRLRLWFHGKKTAYTPNADACRACGLCVVACQERAITLVPTG